MRCPGGRAGDYSGGAAALVVPAHRLKLRRLIAYDDNGDKVPPLDALDDLDPAARASDMYLCLQECSQ